MFSSRSSRVRQRAAVRSTVLITTAILGGLTIVGYLLRGYRPGTSGTRLRRWCHPLLFPFPR